MEFNQDWEQEKISGRESNPSQSGNRDYDWVDNCEDEDGVVFMKHKEVSFYGKGQRKQSFFKLREPKNLDA